MKYLKLFENKNWEKELPSKLEELSYILEDEGFIISILPRSEERTYSKKREVIINIISYKFENSMNMEMQSRLEKNKRIKMYERDFVINKLINPHRELILEYIKRASDILKKEKVNIMKFTINSMALFFVDLDKGAIYRDSNTEHRRKLVERI